MRYKKITEGTIFCVVVLKSTELKGDNYLKIFFRDTTKEEQWNETDKKYFGLDEKHRAFVAIQINEIEAKLNK